MNFSVQTRMPRYLTCVFLRVLTGMTLETHAHLSSQQVHIKRPVPPKHGLPRAFSSYKSRCSFIPLNMLLYAKQKGSGHWHITKMKLNSWIIVCLLWKASQKEEHCSAGNCPVPQDSEIAGAQPYIDPVLVILSHAAVGSLLHTGKKTLFVLR